MPAFTTHLNLYLPGGGSLGIGGDDEEADVDKINQNMQKIDDWADDTDDRLGILDQQLTRNQQFTDIAANIGSVVGMKLGDTYQETDGNKVLWRYDGANWITNESGMYLVRPTSVAGTGVVLNPDGSVSFTGASSVSLNGVFSSRFRNYEIQWNIDSRTGGASYDYLRLRAGGTDNSASYAFRRGGTSGAGWQEAVLASANEFPVGMSALNTSEKTIRVSNPASATLWTRIYGGYGIDTDGTNFSNLATFAGEHRVASAHDGLTLFTGNPVVISGTIRVRGLA